MLRLILVCLVVPASLVAGQCLFGFRSNPVEKANELLVQETSSEKLDDNFEAAIKIMNSDTINKCSSGVREILGEFLRLKPMNDQLMQNNLLCKSKYFRQFGPINESLLKHLKGNNSPDGKELRMTKLIDSIQKPYSRLCFEKLKKDFRNETVLLDSDLSSRLSNFLAFLRTRQQGISWRNAILINAAKGNHVEQLSDFSKFGAQKWAQVMVSFLYYYRGLGNKSVKELFEIMVAATCNEARNSGAKQTLHRIITLVQSVGYDPEIFQLNGDDDNLIYSASGYQVCEDLKYVDEAKLIKAVEKEVKRQLGRTN